MKRLRLNDLFGSCVVLVGVLFATCASAGSSGIPIATTVDPQGDWTVGTNSNSDVVITGSTSYTPNADPILKIFVLDWSDWGGGDVTGFYLIESITNSGSTPWTAWDSELLVPDGAGGWMPSAAGDDLDVSVVNQFSLPATVQCGGVSLSLGQECDGSVLSLNWNALIQQNDTIDFTLFVSAPRYLGVDENNNPQPLLQFAMAQYPTAVVPVPAAAWLFGSGLIGLIGLARKRKTS